MKGFDKRVKKKISCERRDLWDSKPYWHSEYKELKKEKLKSDTGGIKKGKQHEKKNDV